MPRPPQILKILLAAFALGSLATGVLAGLDRLGFGLPLPRADLAAVHGPLMMAAFMGTLISLERAVAFGTLPALAAPAFFAAGAGVLAAGGAWPLAGWLWVVGAGLLSLLQGVFLRRQPNAPMAGLLAAGLLLLGGNLVWTLHAAAWQAAGLWAGFLLLTIASERLELARFSSPPAWNRLFLGGAAAVIAGAVAVPWVAPAGWRVFGAGSLVMAAWLARFEPVFRRRGLAGFDAFSAACLRLAYAWLALGGLLALLAFPAEMAGPRYDAALHAYFLGFAFSMVFAHAHLVLPQVAGLRFSFHRGFTAALLLLHASLALRLSGDLLGGWQARRWGAAGNGGAILLFFLSVAYGRLRHRRVL